MNTKAGLLGRHTARIDKILNKKSSKLRNLRNFRLFTGIGLVVLFAFMAKAPNADLVLLAAVIITVFSVLIRTTRKLENHLGDLSELRAFYTRQMERIAGQPPEAFGRWTEAQTALDLDLDLTGKRSVLGLINETFTHQGLALLVKGFESSPISADQIKNRQQATLAFSKYAAFLRRLHIEGHRNRDFFLLHSVELEASVNQPYFSAPPKAALPLLLLLWLAWLGSLTTNSLPPLLVWFCYAAINFWLITKMLPAWPRLEITAKNLTRLLPIFKRIEKLKANKNLTDHVSNLGTAPTIMIQKISTPLNFLSTASHPIVNAILNGFCPWTVFFSILAESRRSELAKQLPSWLRCLSETEYFASLAFVYRYQSSTMPELTQHGKLQFKGLWHPLLAINRRTPTSFELPGKIALVSGSNMSGKSTFLRTIGVNQIMTHLGGPVFAESYASSPCHVATCLRISDSITEGFSFFYAEVLRLKDILTSAERGLNVLYLVDEVFRGTNNRERFKGALSFINAISKTSAIGFITTHDLDLATAANTNSAISNWHFKDQVINGKMVFDYQIQPGPCPSTNALRIMADAGLPVEIPL